MGSVCADQPDHKFHHHSHQMYLNKKTLREIDIPPRKLLSRRSAVASSSPSDMFVDSPKVENSMFQKFLPYNNVDDDDSDPYSSDHFRMFEFKVRKCTRSRSHDWTDCPFAHPGEKARRRDPRRFHYSGTVCSEFRKGHCNKGDNCEFAHGVFECWLHPSRYRTEACKDGKNCKRKVCFFAHSSRQLRMPESSSPPRGSSPVSGEKKYRNLNHCCMYCHSSMTASPTSTLMSMAHLSPPISPPISPVKATDFSPVSRYADRFAEFGSGGMSYKDAVIDLMTSMEAMSVNSPVAHGSGKLPWLDVNCHVDEQTQFILSPPTPTPTPGSSRFFHGDQSKFVNGDSSSAGRNYGEEIKYNNEGGLAGIDLGWVNDLLT